MVLHETDGSTKIAEGRSNSSTTLIMAGVGVEEEGLWILDAPSQPGMDRPLSTETIRKALAKTFPGIRFFLIRL